MPSPQLNPPPSRDQRIQELQEHLRQNQQLLQRHAGTPLAATLREDGRRWQQELDQLQAPHVQAA